MATLTSATKDLDALVVLLENKKKLRSTLKRTLAQESRKVKAKVVKTVKGLKIDKAAELAKNVRAGVDRKTEGYYVSVSSRAKASMHLNRRGKLKPVALWVNTGTKNRRWRKKHHPTGSTPAYNFMASAQPEIEASKKRIGQTFETNVRKMADKILNP